MSGQRDHRTISVSEQAYRVLSETASHRKVDRKALASEAILSLVRKDSLVCLLKVGIGMALIVGVFIGMVIV